MKTEKDPTAVNSVKIPQQPKAKRNEPNYWARKNMKRIHPVTERTAEDMEKAQSAGIKEALKNE